MLAEPVCSGRLQFEHNAQPVGSAILCDSVKRALRTHYHTGLGTPAVTILIGEADDEAFPLSFLTQVGHLGNHILTPAAGSFYPGPLASGIGGPLHRNTQHRR